MATLEKVIAQIRASPTNVSFNNLIKVCSAYFERKPSSGTSHVVFKTPWQGDPRINIQNSNVKAKAYQVRQVLNALDTLKNTQK